MEISDDVTFDTDAFYALAEGVVAEVIDGEAVLVSFSQARYYACRGLGALVVSALLAGAVSERAFSLQIARATSPRRGRTWRRSSRACWPRA
jgi:hypothetical protein